MERGVTRLIMLAAIKRVALAILCAILLMLVANAAWADQCSAPTVGEGAGAVGTDVAGLCSVVITVTSVDGGHATAFTATTTGTPAYDGVEDILVGVQNNSGSALSSVTLSSPDISDGGIFNFDGDGPCNTSIHPHPPGYVWCPATYSDPAGYEGPNNTFSVDGGTQCTVNNVATTCHMSGTVNFTAALQNNDTTWFALEGRPESLISQTQLVTTEGTTFYEFQNHAFGFTAHLNAGSSVEVTVTPIIIDANSCNSLVRNLVSFPDPNHINNHAQCFIYKDANGPTHDSPVMFEITCNGSDCSSLDGELGTNFDLASSEPNFSSADPFPGWLKGHGPDPAHPCAQSPGNDPPLFQSNQIDSYDPSRSDGDPYTKGGSGGTGSCWVATYNQPDEAPPGITINSPTATTYTQGQAVTANYSCSDPSTSNLPQDSAHPRGPYLTVVQSTCNGPVPSGTGSVDTSTVGSHTFTVTAQDTGQNQATKSVTYIVVPPPTDLAILKVGNLSVRAGGTVTYTIGVGDLGPANGSGVTVSDTLPADTTLVSASGSNVSCSIVNRRLVCSTAPISCPGTTTAGATTVNCSVGTVMPLSLSSLNGAAIRITVRLGSTWTAGKTVKNTASVSSSNADTRTGNNSSTASTLVTR